MAWHGMAWRNLEFLVFLVLILSFVFIYSKLVASVSLDRLHTKSVLSVGGCLLAKIG